MVGLAAAAFVAIFFFDVPFPLMPDSAPGQQYPQRLPGGGPLLRKLVIVE
jgi:hypothetical protein